MYQHSVLSISCLIKKIFTILVKIKTYVNPMLAYDKLGLSDVEMSRLHRGGIIDGGSLCPGYDLR